MIRRIVSGMALVAVMARGAEDQVRSTQEELRRRNVFFGDIDGRRSEEYSEAVRRYQKRKGLAVSGQEDHDTLRSLGVIPRSLNEPPPKELEWPAEPVLKSDSHLDVPGAAQGLADQTGVAPVAIAPDPQPDRSQPPALNRMPASQRHVEPAMEPSAKPSKSQPAPISFKNPAAAPSALNDFVSQYLRAISRNRLKDELHFYADRVNYFGHRQVDRRIIEETLRKYYLRWPKRSYSLAGRVGYQFVPSRGEIVLTYRESFSLKNKHSQVRGQTDNRLIINAATSDPRIVEIAERRVRH